MYKAIIETPYAGDVQFNIDFARRCISHALHHGFAPLASHLLYTQPTILDDDDPEERELGITAGHRFYGPDVACLMFVDNGISSGMIEGLRAANRAGSAFGIYNLSDNPSMDDVKQQLDSNARVDAQRFAYFDPLRAASSSATGGILNART
jgi:hypothetical protein